MTATLMSEAELVDLIGGQINRSVGKIQGKAEHLPEVLAEFGIEIAKAVASAIHANTRQTLAIATQRGETPQTTKQYYDHLSQCIDGY